MNKLIILISLLFSASAFSELAIVVHPSNSSNLTQKDVYKIFLGKSKTFPNGKKAIAFNQSEGASARTKFESEILNKPSHQLKAYWSKQVFTGKGKPPKALDSDAKVIEKVKTDPSAIGYVDKANLAAGVKVVSLAN